MHIKRMMTLLRPSISCGVSYLNKIKVKKKGELRFLPSQIQVGPVSITGGLLLSFQGNLTPSTHSLYAVVLVEPEGFEPSCLIMLIKPNSI
jgi:hypothetical protein